MQPGWDGTQFLCDWASWSYARDSDDSANLPWKPLPGDPRGLNKPISTLIMKNGDELKKQYLRLLHLIKKPSLYDGPWIKRAQKATRTLVYCKWSFNDQALYYFIWVRLNRKLKRLNLIHLFHYRLLLYSIQSTLGVLLKSARRGTQSGLLCICCIQTTINRQR